MVACEIFEFAEDPLSARAMSSTKFFIVSIEASANVAEIEVFAFQLLSASYRSLLIIFCNWKSFIGIVIFGEEDFGF